MRRCPHSPSHRLILSPLHLFPSLQLAQAPTLSSVSPLLYAGTVNMPIIDDHGTHLPCTDVFEPLKSGSLAQVTEREGEFIFESQTSITDAADL